MHALMAFHARELIEEMEEDFEIHRSPPSEKWRNSHCFLVSTKVTDAALSQRLHQLAITPNPKAARQ